MRHFLLVVCSSSLYVAEFPITTFTECMRLPVLLENAFSFKTTVKVIVNLSSDPCRRKTGSMRTHTAY